MDSLDVVFLSSAVATRVLDVAGIVKVSETSVVRSFENIIRFYIDLSFAQLCIFVSLEGMVERRKNMRIKDEVKFAVRFRNNVAQLSRVFGTWLETPFCGLVFDVKGVINCIV